MAKAVVAALRDCGFRNGTIIARNAAAGRRLADQYGFKWRETLSADGAPLLVNVTPLGMEGADEAALAFPPEQIAACAFAFDMVAQPARTPFILVAEADGKPVISGAEVIVLQAIDQFELYTGIRPDMPAIADAAAFAHGERVAERIITLAREQTR